jgi:hypothetical protein
MKLHNSSILGNFSGRFGDVVVVRTKGKTYVRKFVAPSNPQTPKQVAQRMKFSLVTNILKVLRGVIIIGFGENSGYHKSVSLALNNAIKGVYPNFSLDYSKLQLSSGRMPKCQTIDISIVSGNKVSINWKVEQWMGTDISDLASIVFLHPIDKLALFLQNQVQRSAGNFETQLPDKWAGVEIHSWIFFTSEDGKHRSDSQYLGPLTF